MRKRTTYRVIRVHLDGTERLVTWSYDLERACNAACGCALIANLTGEEAAELTGMDAATLKDPLPRARSFEVREGKTVLRRIWPAGCDEDRRYETGRLPLSACPECIRQARLETYSRRVKRRLALESSRTPEEVQAYRQEWAAAAGKALAALEAELEPEEALL